MNPNTTKLQIGDIVFNIPPTDIAVSQDNGFVNFSSLRTDQHAILTGETSEFAVSVNIIFPSISEQGQIRELRLLLAMYRMTPFIRIRNEFIEMAFQIGRAHV